MVKSRHSPFWDVMQRRLFTNYLPMLRKVPEERTASAKYFSNRNKASTLSFEVIIPALAALLNDL